MWYPKSPLQWVLVVIAGSVVCGYLFGFVVGIVVAAALLVLWFFIAFSNRNKVPVAQDGFAQASYDVPHGTFAKTPEGFTFSFNKTKIAIHRSISSASNPKGAAEGVGVLIGLGVVGAIRLAQKGSHIEVNREAVIVDGKKMARREFGGFNISHTWKGAHIEGSLVVLGYRFGSQNFEFGGGWPEGQGTEVANALNFHLRNTPSIDDELTSSPEMLRASRPTDF